MKYLAQNITLSADKQQALLFPYSKHIAGILAAYAEGKPPWFRFECVPLTVTYKARNPHEEDRMEHVLAFRVNCLRTAAVLAGFMGGYMSGIRAFALDWDRPTMDSDIWLAVSPLGAIDLARIDAEAGAAPELLAPTQEGDAQQTTTEEDER